LVREGDLLVLDDVRLISGPEDKQRVDMKAAMRTELSRFRGRKPGDSDSKANDGAATVVAGATSFVAWP